MKILDKLRSQPEHIRKLILWIIVVIVGLVLAILWVYSSWWKIKKFPKEEFIKELNLPSINK